jgi:hypothetical protein
MHTAVRLGGYAAALALAFGAAWGVGAAVGPRYVPSPPAPAAAPAGSPDDGMAGMDMSGMDMGGMAGHTADAPSTSTATDGLAATADGYSLVPRTTTFTPGQPGELAFTVTDADGATVSAFESRAGTRMRLAVVRRDAAGFVQPEAVLTPDGVWRAPLVLPAAGVYRVYADFTPSGGPALVLGTDLFAPGAFAPVTFAPSRVAQVDGYQVRLDGDLVAGHTSQVFATVSRDGQPVTDLEPLNTAFGDLVVLRRSDLATVPVDYGEGPAPTATDRSGPAVAFTTTAPSTGGYRLFLTFRTGGSLHLAEFTLETRDGS